MLRKMIRSGYKIKNAPPARQKKEKKSDYERRIAEGKWDFAFVYSAEDIYKITKTRSLRNYLEIQNLR